MELWNRQKNEITERNLLRAITDNTFFHFLKFNCLIIEKFKFTITGIPVMPLVISSLQSAEQVIVMNYAKYIQKPYSPKKVFPALHCGKNLFLY